MKTVAAQPLGRLEYTEVSTEEELRSTVISEAKEHGISLTPEQVKVERTFTPESLDISLAAEYEARVNLLGFSFGIHFAPTSSYAGAVTK